MLMNNVSLGHVMSSDLDDAHTTLTGVGKLSLGRLIMCCYFGKLNPVIR